LALNPNPRRIKTLIVDILPYPAGVVNTFFADFYVFLQNTADFFALLGSLLHTHFNLY
jgi:hypothetical protein